MATKPITNAVQGVSGNSLFERTPQDVQIKICQYLDSSEILGLPLVSKNLNIVVGQSLVWQMLFSRRFPEKPISSKATVKQQYRNTLNARIQNFVHGKYIAREFQAHVNNPVQAIAIFNGRLFTGSSDSTVKIWEDKGNGKGFEEVQTLRGHTGMISCLRFHQGKLFTGSCWDRTVKIWEDKENGKGFEVVQTLQGNAGRINCFGFLQGRLFTGSYDYTVKIWEDKRDGKGFVEVQTLHGHIDGSSCFGFHQGRLFTGSLDKTVKIWEDKRDGKGFVEVQTLQGHTDWISCLGFFQERLLTGSEDKTVKIWENKGDGKGFEEVQTLREHTRGILCLGFLEGRLYTGSDDMTVKIWEVKEKGFKLIEKISTGKSVLSLCFNKGIAYLGKAEGYVQILDYSASPEQIFEHLTEEFEKPRLSNEKITNLKGRLLRMPKKSINAIFGKLFKVLKPKKSIHKHAENAFHEKKGLSCTAAQIAEAIRLFLESTKPKNTPSLDSDSSQESGSSGPLVPFQSSSCSLSNNGSSNLEEGKSDL